MNILYISHERKMGGANLCLFELAQEMQKRGHHVYVAVLFKGCPIDVQLREAGIETVSCFFGWWLQPAYWGRGMKFAFRMLHGMQFIAKHKLCQFVEKHQIEVIHSNSSCIDIGMQVAALTHTKHVWHFREYGLEDYRLEYMFGRAESIKRVVNDTDKVIFISQALRDAYADIDHNTAAEIIYDGVSEKYKGEPKEYHQKPVFLITGNLSANKNQMLILQAVLELKKRGVTDFKVLFAGESTSLKASKDYKQQLGVFIKKYDLTNVEMLGYVSDMENLRQKTDVEIVASVSEAFGRVTVEAMLARNPVIVSNAGANPELVQHGKNGFIFENGNAQELALQMEKVIEKPELLKTMGETAYHFAKDRFTIQENARRIEGVYKEISGGLPITDKRVCVILVNYNGNQYNDACIASIFGSSCAEQLQIVVVDNASTDGSRERLADIWGEEPRIKILPLDANYGFSKANNEGIRWAVENGFERYLLLNNDTTIDSKAIEAMVKCQETSCGIVIPKIYYADRPDVLWCAGGIVTPVIWKACWRGQGKQDKGQFDKAESCKLANGCCMLLDHDIINKLGYLDERFFLYYEDTEYSMRAWQKDIGIDYFPAAVVYHKVNGATKGNEQPANAYYITRNWLLCNSLHMKKGRFGLFLLYFMANRLAWMGIWLLQRKRGMIKAVIQGFLDFSAGRDGKY